MGCRGNGGATSVKETATLALHNVKPVPNWLERALTGNYNYLEVAKRQKNLLGQARAERAIARLRAKAGI